MSLEEAIKCSIGSADLLARPSNTIEDSFEEARQRAQARYGSVS
jgi:hypothetical protein